ncbi:hypothetical protein CRM22_006304 [Opisthorchis felineus]|uniref:DEP domain-containing protein n=1 Tax=Opisthorchis felineus TaxID=147828 RepID=A0A4V3SEH5_OPIFE|nr:hypothetical protein CRM22_006304 [Opisthorchis felineus]TGZ64584.1 hypothetical protein CRM22_006304 [Opisthorchis felineus]
MNTPPRLKLQYHQSNDSRGIVADDVRLSSRNTPGVAVGDVIEVYHPGDAHHALFLVSALREDIQWRDTISIEQSLANILKLQAHKNVCIQIVEKKSVTLDLVELCFRDQYFSRSDLYRFSQELLGTVLQVHRKIVHNEMRVQVGELWRKGEVYSCGYVGPETKIVFRSATSVIQIFIQLSEEMWLFDEHGDLYFENALKFLSKLFLRAWPEGNCHHDVTVVFFTRVYIDDLPSVYHGRASRDSEGRFFDDFYRVLIQNERLSWDEWKRVLTQLKLEFKMFQQELTAYLQSRYPMHDGSIASSVHVSSAFDGNFMETLNMSLNLYGGYNVDRNFDRTGKSSIVISPGNGSHRVNSTLLLITKQRILDLGVGVDLICLGQQPLHAVPLLEVSDWDTNKYIVPYWIDCSFFRSGHQIRRINLGQPVNRTRVTPCVSSPCSGLDFAASIVSEQQSPVQFQLNSCSTAVARRKPPVYKIIYPQSTVNLMPSLKPITSENAHFLSGRFTSSPETNESSKCLQSCTDQNLFPSTTDHVLTAITTASAVARAVQNASQRPSRCSESDSSSVGDFDWERGLESLAPETRCSAHRGGLSVEKSLIKSSTQPMIVKGQNTRHLSVVASLPSVREHQPELIKSGQLDRVCFMQAVHRNVVVSEARKKSLSSDADGSVSASSSVDSSTTPGSAEFRPPGTMRHTRFSKTYSFTAQRPSSYVGSASDHASKTPALPGLHTQLTPSAPSYRRKSSSRQIRTGFRWSNTFGSGVRVSSTLFPVPASNNPFEAAGNPLSPTGTAGKRRWVLVRPPDEFGNPIPPHHIHLSVRSWDFPNPREAIESCSQVWATYFNFLRERLGHSAPGGPLPSMDHTDSRTIAGLSSNHVRRSLQLPSGAFSKFSVSREEETWLKGHPLLDQTSSFGPRQWKSLFDPIQHCSVQDDPPHCSGDTLGQSCQLTGGSTLKCLIDTVRNVRNSTSRPPPFLPSEDRAQSDTRGAMLKNVLRLIGTDWKSLSTPALLPIATDYFPDNSSLKTEGYTLHDYRVVPVGVSAQEWESTHDFKREPGLSYCRRPMTVREVFYEMVLQRLGHGFQIYEESLAPSAPPVSSTVGSPGSPLSGTVTGVSPPSLLRSSAIKPVTTRCEQWSNRNTSGSSSLSRKHGVSLGHGRLGNRQRNAPEAPSIGVSPPATQPTQTCTTIAVRTLGIGLTLSSTGSSVRTPSKHLARPGRAGCRTPFLTQPLLDKLVPAHKTSFKLSIGRLFHSISLVDDSITLTNYRFRQEDPLRTEYTYSLRVPDSLTYLPLRTVFTNDTINGLNWSYLDNYLCTRGVSDSYVLLPSLKYWRSRFMMLPIYSNETRRLQDAVERMNINGPRVACDVYEDYRLMNHAKFCENFVHFIESINRIRRPPSSARKPARQD